MKSILIFLVLALFADDINKIAAINRLKKEAELAYEDGNYQDAVRKYSILVDSLGHRDDKLLLNFSNACYKANDTLNAQLMYNQLTDTEDPAIKSLAYQQLGIMANDQKKYKESLHYFKNSLKADPNNEDSRYNYELLKKMMQNQQPQDQQNQQNKDQQEQEDQQKQQEQQDQQQEKDQNNEEQQNEEQQQQEQQQDQQKEEQDEKSDQEKEQENDNKNENENQPEPQKMEDMKISEEMAKKILEAMRNNEIQYLQQQQRKPTKPKESGKPDW